jgi:hypothetical protein
MREATTRDVLKIKDERIRGKRMSAENMKMTFRKLNISDGYTRTIFSNIDKIESEFPGSLYWLNKKNMLLEYDLLSRP